MNQSQEIFGPPKRGVQNKIRSHMTESIQSYIKDSPFLVMASSNSVGHSDASPKGGKPGFVKVVDKHHLIIPDISGNNLFQTYENIETNPYVGLLFFIPGRADTVRVNGKASILRMGDHELDDLEPELYSHDSKSNIIQALMIEVAESYDHCPRAIMFSRLWDSSAIENKRWTSSILRRIYRLINIMRK